MSIKGFIFRICAIVMVFMASIVSAEALSFAEYAYRQAKAGHVSNIQSYLTKGYNVDAPDSNGFSALCMAVRDRDYQAYQNLLKLGAKTEQRCMKRLDNVPTKQYRTQVVSTPRAHSVPVTTTSGQIVSSTDYKPLYIGAGLLAAGGAVALALSSGGSSHGSSKPGKFCPQGQKIVDGKCVPIVCPEGTVLKGDVCEPVDKCGENERWDGTKCVPLNCPTGTHLVGDKCVPDDTCPTGTQLVDGVCEPIVCPDGTHLVGDACVKDRECPTGQRKVGDECVPIVCPEGTSLVGNICVADESASKEQVGDDDLYGISSDNEDVFNLYSSPSYPDDEQSIVLKNKGNGNVYGMYGYRGEVFNSYVVGKNNGYQNKKPVGTGTIRIKDEGSGTVYGIYSHISDITQYMQAMNAAGFYEGTAYGKIDIEHTGGGATYGLSGDVRAYNTYTTYGGNAYGDITIHADGDIYGIYGYVAATNGLSPWLGNYARGDINLYSVGDGNIYGMAINRGDIPGAGGTGESWFAFNSYGGDGNIEGHINIHNTGNGNVYGMYGGQQLYNATSQNSNKSSLGTINVTNLGNGDVYGMYIPDTDTSARIENVSDERTTSIINLTNTGNGVTTGMRGGQGVNVLNSGTININNVGDGTAVGLYGNQYSKITNTGTINIYRDSFVDKTDGKTYTPQSTFGGRAYGIYAEKGSKVINSGIISVSGASNGQGIYLEDGATLENSGEVYFNGNSDSITTGGNTIDIYGDRATRTSVNINDLGGEIILNTGGKFFANSLSGDLAVSEKVTLNSFDDEYNLSGALQTQNAEKLNLASKSVLYTAEKRKNDQNSYDVVLKRRSFDSLLANKDAASFWEDNYRQGNGLGLYNDLKLASSVSELQKKEANLRGADVLPGFRRENALVYNHLSRQFNDNLFNKPDEKYIGGYKYLDISRDNDGIMQGNDGTSHTAYGLLKDTASNGMTYGLGLTISQLKSDYDNGSERKSNIFGLWAPIGTNFAGGTQWYSKFYAGYEDGSYDRVTALQKYSGDINSYQYGLSNEIRHPLSLGHGVIFSPAAELNLLGVYQEGFNEGESIGAINTKDKNLLSMEGGLGAYLSKELFFGNSHKIGVRIGGIYYVEFLDPDDGYNARMKGMAGRYKISHKSDDGRAVFSARVDYTYKNLTLYGLLEQETGDYKAWSIDAGIQYNL